MIKFPLLIDSWCYSFFRPAHLKIESSTRESPRWSLLGNFIAVQCEPARHIVPRAYSKAEARGNSLKAQLSRIKKQYSIMVINKYVVNQRTSGQCWEYALVEGLLVWWFLIKRVILTTVCDYSPQAVMFRNAPELPSWLLFIDGFELTQATPLGFSKLSHSFHKPQWDLFCSHAIHVSYINTYFRNLKCLT